MRIIAGQHRGLRLANVGKGDAEAHLRPTSDRVRESLFSVLLGGAYGDPITDARVLDLFAGTGALGLEALSRGAAHTVFVDNGRKAQSLIRDNIRLTGRAADTTLIRHDATRLSANTGPPATLVFLDPPYGKSLGAAALEAARNAGWIAPGALVVWEEGSRQEPPTGLRLLDQRRYGESWINLMTS